MKKITKQQWLGLTRHLLTFVGGILITQGVLDEAMFTELSGAVMALVGGIWSIVDKVKEAE